MRLIFITGTVTGTKWLIQWFMRNCRRLFPHFAGFVSLRHFRVWMSSVTPVLHVVLRLRVVSAAVYWFYSHNTRITRLSVNRPAVLRMSNVKNHIYCNYSQCSAIWITQLLHKDCWCDSQNDMYCTEDLNACNAVATAPQRHTTQ